MALTDAQKSAIVYYTGQPAKIIEPNTEFYNPIFVSRLNGYSADAELRISDLLIKLAATEERIRDSETRMLASKIEDIEVNKAEYAALQKAFRGWKVALSNFTDLPLVGYSAYTGAAGSVGCYGG